jgi:hypothetical protein
MPKSKNSDTFEYWVHNIVVSEWPNNISLKYQLISSDIQSTEWTININKMNKSYSTNVQRIWKVKWWNEDMMTSRHDDMMTYWEKDCRTFPRTSNGKTFTQIWNIYWETICEFTILDSGFVLTFENDPRIFVSERFWITFHLTEQFTNVSTERFIDKESGIDSDIESANNAAPHTHGKLFIWDVKRSEIYYKAIPNQHQSPNSDQDCGECNHKYHNMSSVRWRAFCHFSIATGTVYHRNCIVGLRLTNNRKSSYIIKPIRSLLCHFCCHWWSNIAEMSAERHSIVKKRMISYWRDSVDFCENSFLNLTFSHSIVEQIEIFQRFKSLLDGSFHSSRIWWL